MFVSTCKPLPGRGLNRDVILESLRGKTLGRSGQSDAGHGVLPAFEVLWRGIAYRAGSGVAHAQVLDWSPTDCYLAFTLVNHTGNSSRKHSFQIT